MGRMRSPLEQAIINTLAWFDVVNYPLTPQEIHRFLYVRSGQSVQGSLQDVERVLTSGALTPHVAQTDVFWHLRGRQDLVETRNRRFAISGNKWRIAKRAARLISWLPFVRMIAVVNTVSYHNAKEDSDIDLLIVAQQGRMFTVRWLVTMVLDLFRLRRHGVHIQDRVCLSFYMTNGNLSLAHLRIPGEDSYLAYWHEWLTPLYSDGDTFEHFLAANQWVRQQLPNAFMEEKHVRLFAPGMLMNAKKRLLEKLLGASWAGHALEAWARKRQMERFDANTQSKAGEPGTAVVISDTMLKFHEQDRREEFRERYLSRLRELGE